MKCLKDAPKKTIARDEKTKKAVEDIIAGVKEKGDEELLELSRKFDGLDLETVKISKEEIAEAYAKIPAETIEAMKKAHENIEFYAKKQYECLKDLPGVSNTPGVVLSHRLIPVEAVGCYVPGGRYPLPSTALMLITPAKIAGCSRVVACAPAAKAFGSIHPATLVAMDIAGADEIYCTGGAQAIAAMAYGTQTIRAVDLICGPGNRFVTEAKRQVLGDVGIDSLAGPSEVLILADETAKADFIAADLLAQSEHDPNARATLVTTSEPLAEEVLAKIRTFAGELATGETSLKSWDDNGIVYVVDDIDEGIKIANDFAPEHLELQVKDEDAVAAQLVNFGSLFIGNYAPVAFGDYCSGTNHTLPTMRTARYSNGVWVGTFIKTSFVQHISKEGCDHLADTCMTLAGTEGLLAHRKSVEVRVTEE